MGAQQSKDELLHQQVMYGNVDGIRALRNQGADLEWMDSEGKTPLIVACLRHELLPVAKTLIELGAKVNAYRAGCHAGTPLHHAAKKGIEATVILLLSSGANPYILNDDCQTALDLAREKGHTNVVRAIESRINLFAGWLRESFGPGFLEAFAPQLLSRNIWVVVVPCDHRNPTRPSKFELAIYLDLMVAKPRNVVPLWKAQIEEPRFNQTDPAVVIVDKATKTRFKFLPARKGDKQQVLRFYNACRGIARDINNVAGTPSAVNSSQVTSNTSTALPSSNPEDLELAMAINASIQSAIAEGVPHVLPNHQTNDTHGWGSLSGNPTYNGWGPSDDTSSTVSQAPIIETNTYNGWDASQAESAGLPSTQTSGFPTVRPPQEPPSIVSAPSAPPITAHKYFEGPIHYPSVDSDPVDLSMPDIQNPSQITQILDDNSSVSASGISQAKAGTTTDGSGSVDLSMRTMQKPSQIAQVLNDKSGVSVSGTSQAKAGTTCCVICLDAAVEGACIPCGHMAGCMWCLKEIEEKKWGCPVCRAKIDQVIKGAFGLTALGFRNSISGNPAAHPNA